MNDDDVWWGDLDDDEDVWCYHKGDSRLIWKIVVYGVIFVVVAAVIGIPLLMFV